MNVDPVALMVQIIKEHTPASKWDDAPLRSFRAVANTNRGDIGEDFLLRYRDMHDIPATKSASRVQEWDMEIRGKRFEIKTASEDTGGSFQFNHIRLDRKYNYLLCLGVQPDNIIFGCWGKRQAAEGDAGNLVRMAEGQSITFKLTQRPNGLHPIQELPRWLAREF